MPPGLRHALWLAYGRRGIERSIHGEPPLRLRPRYRSVSENVEPLTFAAIKRHVVPGETVFDVGANIGLFSMLMARWVGPGGSVFAFEPAPEALTAARTHVKMNGLSSRVTVVGAAVSNAAGSADFFAHTYSGENTLNPAFAGRVPDAVRVRVPVITLDAFCAEHDLKPSLIKIDVEGFEEQVLLGAKKLILNCRPKIVLETHPAAWRECGTAPDGLERFFRGVQYAMTGLEDFDPIVRAGHILASPAVHR